MARSKSFFLLFFVEIGMCPAVKEGRAQTAVGGICGVVTV
jgi:hypothetical protein